MVNRTIYRNNVWLKIDNVDSVPSYTAVYWYFLWWQSSWNTTKTDRITFSTWTTAANTTSNLSTAQAWFAWLSDKTTYWYSSWWEWNLSLTNRLTFSTWANAANTTSVLDSNKFYHTAISSWGTYWYMLWWLSSYWWSKNTSKITFSTWVYSSWGYALSSYRYDPSSVSDWATYWYMSWWINITTLTDRITFSTSVISANTVSNLSWNRWYVRWLSDWSTYWYMCWWYTWGNWETMTDRIVFSTWVTSSATVSVLNTARRLSWNVSDGWVYWYLAWWQWSSGETLSSASRITFSTWVFAANTVSNLSVWVFSLASYSDFAV